MKKFFRKTLTLTLIFSILLNYFPIITVMALDETGDVPVPKKEVINNAPTINTKAKVLSEDTSKRKKNEKHFFMSDGTKTVAVYPTDVHYEQNGKLVDIDNTLISIGEEYAPKSSPLKVKFSKNIKNDKILSFENKGFTIDWSLVGMSKKSAKEIKKEFKNDNKYVLTNIDSSLVYENVLPSTNLSYEVMPNKIKENIVLTSKEAINNKFVFQLNTNLKATLEDDNTIVLTNEKDEIFIIEAPYMYDMANEMSDHVTLKLTPVKTGYMIELVPDGKWLNDEKRIYPITIDPTIKTSRVVDSIEDTFVFDGDDNNPTRHEAHIIRVGANSLGSGASYGTPFRGLIKFTLPELSTGDQIVNAELKIYNYQDTTGWNPPAETIQIDIHRITGNWNVTAANWDNTVNLCNDNKIIDYFMYSYSTSNPNKENTANITSLVKNWYTNGGNYGIMLKEHTESIPTTNRQDMSFLSSNTNLAYLEQRPAILITYRNQTGIEEYMSYHSQSAGRAGTIYTNDYNGNMILLHSDANTSGERLPVSINHVFNTNDKDINIGYGLGFRLNLSQRIESTPIDGVQYYLYTDEDGTKHSFYQEGSVYRDEDGLGLTLTLSSNTFTMEDKAGNKSTFTNYSNYWRLTRITDTSNNYITINYSGDYISSVIDATGETITLNYANNLLSGITDASNRTLNYYYTNNHLTSIRYYDNLYSYYEYNTNNTLYKAKNIDNSYLEYTYYTVSPFRVYTIKEYGTNNTTGNSLTIQYSENTTIFTDNRNNKNTFAFNNYGQLVSVADFGNTNNNLDTAYGKMYRFSNANTATMNHLQLESDLSSIVNNYVMQGSVEESNTTTYWKTQDLGSVTTHDIVTTNAYFGSKSLRLSSSSTTNINGRWYQTSTTASKGKTYTLSAYLKLDNIVSTSNGLSFYISYNNAAGTTITTYGDKLTGTKDWKRYSYTFTYPSDATSNLTVGIALVNASGTAYIDAMQLEIGDTPNHYNLISNNTFDNNLTNWTTSAFATGDGVTTADNNKVLTITGLGTKRANAYQNIYLSGQKDDVFNVSLWAKLLGVPLNGDKGASIRVNFVGTDGTSNWKQLNLNADAASWQYFSEEFIAPVNYSRIDIYVCFYYNANNAYFDNIALYRDPQNTSYTYDPNGNVIKTSTKADQQNTLQYNFNSQLLKKFTLNGSEYGYEYNPNNKSQLLKAIDNNLKVQYSFTYNEYGQQTKAEVKNNYKNNVINNGSYYIENISTGKVIDNQGGTPTDLKKFHQYTFSGITNQQLIFTKLDTTYYKIETVATPNKAFTLNTDGYIVMTTHSNLDTQKWELITNSDGSYQIKCKSNNKVITIQSNSTNNGIYYITTDYKALETQKFRIYDITKDDAYNQMLIESNEVYRLRLKSTNKYWDYYINTSGIYRPIQAKFDASKKSQLWRIVKKEGNVYEINNLDFNNGWAVKVHNGTDAQDRAIHLIDYTNDTYQKWYLIKNDDGTFTIKSNVPSGRVIGLYTPGTSDSLTINTNTNSDNQKFYLEKVNALDIEDGTYSLKVYDKSIGVLGNADTSNVALELQTTTNTNNNQQWVFTNLHNGYYKISPKYTTHNMVLTLQNNSNNDNTNFVLMPESSIMTNNYQQFEIIANSDKTFTIKPRISLGKKALNVASNTVGASIKLLPSNGLTNQKITAIEIDDPNELKMTSEVEYSENGKFVDQVSDSLGQTTEYIYNYSGTDKSGTIYNTIDPKGNYTYYTYDLFDRITSVSNGSYTTSYNYQLDKLNTITHNGFNYQFLYNNYNQINSIKVANQTLITNNYQTNNGNLTSSTYGNNQNISYEYDNFNRINKKTTSNNVYNYGYDKSGNLSYIQDNTNKTYYTYDLSGRLINIDKPNYEINYEYDLLNNLNKQTYILNNTTKTTNYTYDKANRISNINYGNSNIIYEYDTLSRLNKIDQVSGTIHNLTTYEYKTIGNKTSTLVSKIINNDTTTEYTYDNNNNIIQIKINNVIKYEYTYDALNQLIKEDNAVLNKTIKYYYDLGGNITSKEEYEYKTTTLLNTITYTYNTTWKDQLLSYNGNTITYDNIGNPLTYNGNTYTWMNGRELQSISGNGNTISYNYNDEGIRTSKTVNGVTTTYYLEGTKVIYETTGSNTIYYLYDSNDNIIGLIYNNSTYYYQKNGQNDIIGLLDSNYNKIISYEYDSWGKLISIKDNNGNLITDPNNIGMINSYRYRSYQYDNETGYYYLQSRYYNPEWGRFLNADVYISTDTGMLGHNMYAYVNNNPINYFDPNGEIGLIIGCLIIGGVAGLFAGGITGAAKSYNDTGKVKASAVVKYSVIGAAGGTVIGAGVGYLGYKISYVAPIVYNSWQQAEQGLRNAYHSVQSAIDRTFNTPFGNRIVDAYNTITQKIGEAKYGYQALSQQIKLEVIKDAYLVRQGYQVVWEFYYSKYSNSIGPSYPLYQELTKSGIKVVIHGGK